MPANRPNPKVDFYFTNAAKWQAELLELRTIMLASGLTEELKWGVPCYTLASSNIALLHAFKHYCAILFPKGALLPDAHRILIQQTANTQGARQIRFTGMDEIVAREAVINEYVQQAVELEKTGTKVSFKATTEYVIPEEFQAKLAEIPALHTTFAALTPGRQRAYLLHFAAPKQARTREARIEKCIPRILNGQGLNE